MCVCVYKYASQFELGLHYIHYYFSSQVWFQNRRMKDKRQRMALAWPFGIADPAIFTYLANAASSPFTPYPYALPSAMPINHYASLGLHRAAAAYHPYAHGMRPAELLSHPTPLSRPPLPGDHLANLVAAQSSLSSGMPTCNIPTRDQSLLMASHPAARGMPTSCLSPRLAAEPLNCHLEKESAHADRKPIIIKPKASKNPITDSSKPSKPTIFRPFGTDEWRMAGISRSGFRQNWCSF